MSSEIDIGSAYKSFHQDVLRDAGATGDPQYAVLFRLFSEAAAENGDVYDLNYAPVIGEGPRPYQLDGYYFDSERGELHLGVCDFHLGLELQDINIDSVKRAFGRAARFCELASDSGFVNSLEETSPAFEVANVIRDAWSSVLRVRCVFFTSSKLETRKKKIETSRICGVEATFNVFDFTRYIAFINSQGAPEPIELDVKEISGSSLPCLEAHDDATDCKSYLIVMPGNLLAKAYGLYGARLMEQNVRTFLQATTKVNKKIIDTAINSPEMFFAFNNGITATASGVIMDEDLQAGVAISKIFNLQIVNGGQTTASLLYAGDKGTADLTKIFVQMKLSVIDPGRVGKIVPLISRYANTQNKVSEADFFSNHEFHLEMQKISRRLDAPRAAGSLTSTRWYYERTRGQYKNDGRQGTSSDAKKFELTYPKNQVIQKTDLAKYILSFDDQPHIVSRGAQKCFLAFAERVGQRWEDSRLIFGESFFKESICKAIAYRWLDGAIGKSNWYSDYRSLKAAIITYTLAYFYSRVIADGRDLDFDRMWNEQDLGADLKVVLSGFAPLIAKQLKSIGGGHVAEYAKTQNCWFQIKESEFNVPIPVRGFLIEKDESASRSREARSASRLDLDIDFDRVIVDLIGRILEVEERAKSKSLLSPTSASAISKIKSGRVNLNKSEKNALKFLLNKLDS